MILHTAVFKDANGHVIGESVLHSDIKDESHAYWRHWLHTSHLFCCTECGKVYATIEVIPFAGARQPRGWETSLGRCSKHARPQSYSAYDRGLVYVVQWALHCRSYLTFYPQPLLAAIFLDELSLLERGE